MNRRTLGLAILGIVLDEVAASSPRYDVRPAATATSFEPEFFTDAPREKFTPHRNRPTGTAKIKRQAKKNRSRK